MAFVLFQHQQHDCQNWQQLVRQGEVVWIFQARITSIKSQQREKVTQWQGKATLGLGSNKKEGDFLLYNNNHHCHHHHFHHHHHHHCHYFQDGEFPPNNQLLLIFTVCHFLAMTSVCTNPVMWVMMIKRNDYKWWYW